MIQVLYNLNGLFWAIASCFQGQPWETAFCIAMCGLSILIGEVRRVGDRAGSR